jgi:hypothetical protein
MGSATFASTLASSSFDDGAEGWKTENGSTGFAWMPTGGDTGGFISASDVGGAGLWFFEAPTAFLTAAAGAYGGTLTYELESSPTSPPIAGSYANVQLLGANGLLLAYGGIANPAATWTPYTVSLSAGNWMVGSVGGPVATQAQLVSVLSDLKDLRIRGDYKQAIETTGLDTVVLSAAPVPEPETYALMLAGLGALAGLSLRRLKNRAA